MGVGFVERLTPWNRLCRMTQALGSAMSKSLCLGVGCLKRPRAQGLCRKTLALGTQASGPGFVSPGNDGSIGSGFAVEKVRLKSLITWRGICLVMYLEGKGVREGVGFLNEGDQRSSGWWLAAIHYKYIQHPSSHVLRCLSVGSVSVITGTRHAAEQ